MTFSWKDSFDQFCGNHETEKKAYYEYFHRRTLINFRYLVLCSSEVEYFNFVFGSDSMW